MRPGFEARMPLKQSSRIFSRFFTLDACEKNGLYALCALCDALFASQAFANSFHFFAGSFACDLEQRGV